MSAPVILQRAALLALVRSAPSAIWIVTGQIKRSGLDVIMPFLVGRPIRVLTNLDPDHIASGQSDWDALAALHALPDCQIRFLPGLTACVYAAEGAMALVSSSPLTLEGLDSERAMGWLTREFDFASLAQWWSSARMISPPAWAALAQEVERLGEMRLLGEEVRRIGAFVDLTMRGARRVRRLDPRDFGVHDGWGRAVRPVEVALYQLDDVRRTRDELEAILAREGVAWNGLYLVPRHFLVKEWPRLFAAKVDALRERLRSPQGQELLEAQLGQARRELQAFFRDLCDRLPQPPAQGEAEWVRDQVEAVLADAAPDAILGGGELAYRVLQVTPEDERSVRELRGALQDPKLRSLQLTFDL